MRSSFTLAAAVGAALVFSATADTARAANLLANGDFSLGSNGTTDPDSQALGWGHAWTAGWINRETNSGGPYGDPSNYHYAIGNAGAINNAIYQSVVVPDDGSSYLLTVDMGMDNWWKPDGYLRIEFKDSADAILSSIQTDILANGYDGNVNQPWANRSVSGTAPAGTASITVVLGAFTTGDGGTTRWDNAVLSAVVPEPASIGLLGLTGLALRRRHR